MSEYQFILRNPSGFPISNSHSLRLAMRTLTVRIANGNCGTVNRFCANGHSDVIGLHKDIEVESAHKGCQIVSADLYMSTLKKMIPAPYAKLVLEGVCYNPGNKYYAGHNKERWMFHVHPPQQKPSDNSDDEFDEPEEEPKKQPGRLQDFCKLSILESCFRMKRNGVKPGIFFQ